MRDLDSAIFALSALLGAAAMLGLPLIAWVRGQRHHLAAALAERDRAMDGEARATRFLRLAALDLRAPAMSLLGHADHLARDGADAASHADAIAVITGQMLRLADDFQDHALPDPATRVLRQERLPFGLLLADAIAAVSATLGPARRFWRKPADCSGIHLLADRRAMAQILVRVLSNAARFSRDGDWIDISIVRSEEGLALIVADEGTGLLAGLDIAGRPGGAASRGVGLGLSLARVLMEAHGGALTVESTAGIGTQVVLGFPAGRVIAAETADAHVLPEA
jgi:signal transduction histidine kinase